MEEERFNNEEERIEVRWRKQALAAEKASQERN